MFHNQDTSRFIKTDETRLKLEKNLPGDDKSSSSSVNCSEELAKVQTHHELNEWKVFI